MKVTKIHLKDFLNFQKDLVIDLTYPSNHPTKAGKPLDKVCLIGQSGTGKSTILNLIKFFTDEDAINPDCLDQKLLRDENVGIHFIIGDTYKFSKWSKGKDEKSIEGLSNVELSYKGENRLSNSECKTYINEHFKERGIKLISFPFDTIRNFHNLSEPSYLDVIEKPEDQISSEKKSLSEKRTNYLEKKIWDFSIDKVQWVWDIVVDQIKEYEPDYIRKVNELLIKLKEDKVNASKYYEQFEEWEQEHENPLKKVIHKCLDNILKKFNLKVNTDFDFEKEEHRKFGRIRQLNDNKEVPTPYLSTGTIQIMVTSIPLSVLDIQETIILFDEPERSLFPDTQIGLINAYTELVSGSQFFFATHSPIVASAFEPSERIIFEFDDEGKVYTDKGVAPEGDDPNDLLYKDFGMHTVLERKGQESFERFIELKTLIQSAKDNEEKQKYMKEFMEIGNKYRFNIENETPH